MIKWNKSKGGFCTSKCGQYQIFPVHRYTGVTLLGYGVALPNGFRSTVLKTQKEAKKYAQEDADRRKKALDDQTQELLAWFKGDIP